MFQKALDDEFEFIINNCGHWEDKRKYKNDPKWKELNSRFVAMMKFDANGKAVKARVRIAPS